MKKVVLVCMLFSLSLYAEELKNSKKIPKGFKFTITDVTGKDATRKELDLGIIAGCPYSSFALKFNSGSVGETKAIKTNSFNITLDKLICSYSGDKFYLMLVAGTHFKREGITAASLLAKSEEGIDFAMLTYNTNGQAEITLDGTVLSEIFLYDEWVRTTPLFVKVTVLVERIY